MMTSYTLTQNVYTHLCKALRRNQEVLRLNPPQLCTVLLTVVFP